MNRRKLQLMRAMHKLSKEQPQRVEESELNKNETEYLFNKSITYGVMFCVAMALTYRHFFMKKEISVSRESEIALNQNQKQSIEEGFNLLEKRYKK